MGVLADGIKTKCLDNILDARVTTAHWRIRLYTNVVVPDQTLVREDLTQATYSGYAAQVLAKGVTVLNGAHEAENSNGTFTFQHNGGPVPNTIRGWYVEDDVNGLVWTEPLDAPKTMAAAGDKLIIALKTMLSQLP